MQSGEMSCEWSSSPSPRDQCYGEELQHRYDPLGDLGGVRLAESRRLQRVYYPVDALGHRCAWEHACDPDNRLNGTNRKSASLLASYITPSRGAVRSTQRTSCHTRPLASALCPPWHLCHFFNGGPVHTLPNLPNGQEWNVSLRCAREELARAMAEMT